LFCNADRTICREELFSDNIIAGLSGKVIRAGRTLPRGGIDGGGVAGGVITGGDVATAFEIPDPIAFDTPAPMVVTVVVGGE
tara:strand:- start:18 stop:263 length:246 start_codon:yes stop_codon:yes gene_type:complete